MAVLVAVEVEIVVAGESEVREEVVTEVVGATSGSLDATAGLTSCFTGGLRFFLHVVLCLLPGIVREMRERPKHSHSCNLKEKDGRFHTLDVTCYLGSVLKH